MLPIICHNSRYCSGKNRTWHFTLSAYLSMVKCRWLRGTSCCR